MPSLEQIWEQYRAVLKAFLRRRVGNADDVEDLLQEILIKIHLHKGELQGEKNVKGWLFQVARNATIDFYRSNSRRKDIHPQDLWYEADEPQLRQELEGCVAPFISALPEDKAKLLTAIDLHGVSQKQYAAQAGISYSTLKSRVQVARGELRRLFDDCCHLNFDTRGSLSDYRSKSSDCKNC